MTDRPAMDGVRAVVLDLGGVLVQVEFERTLAHWARAAGLPRDALDARFAPDEHYERHERGEYGFEEYAASVCRRLGVTVETRHLLEGWNRALGDALPGAAALVAAAAARWPLYLFSNSNAAHHACWARDQQAMLSGFRDVFVSHLLGLRKPEVRAFTAVARHIGLEPHEIAFFDDLPENVAGARRAGMVAHTVAGPQDVARRLGIAPPA